MLTSAAGIAAVQMQWRHCVAAHDELLNVRPERMCVSAIEPVLRAKLSHCVAQIRAFILQFKGGPSSCRRNWEQKNVARPSHHDCHLNGSLRGTRHGCNSCRTLLQQCCSGNVPGSSSLGMPQIRRRSPGGNIVHSARRWNSVQICDQVQGLSN